MCGKNGEPTTWFCNDRGICSPEPPSKVSSPPVIVPRPPVVIGPVSGISAAAPAVNAKVEATLDDSTASAADPIIACPLGDSSCVPSLPAVVTGTWERHAGTLTETLTLRTDASYSLVETTSPVCVRAPCPELPTTILQTAGTYAVNGAVIALSPTVHVPELPESWDIVRGVPVPPIATTPTTPVMESALIVAPILALHAVERGSDVRLTRATATPDCPTGTTKCYQCGAYPPGGVCQTFVCLPPTQRCLPVP
jgi:hypothetical protein